MWGHGYGVWYGIRYGVWYGIRYAMVWYTVWYMVLYMVYGVYMIWYGMVWCVRGGEGSHGMYACVYVCMCVRYRRTKEMGAGEDWHN